MGSFAHERGSAPAEWVPLEDLIEVVTARFGLAPCQLGQRLVPVLAAGRIGLRQQVAPAGTGYGRGEYGRGPYGVPGQGPGRAFRSLEPREVREIGRWVAEPELRACVARSDKSRSPQWVALSGLEAAWIDVEREMGARAPRQARTPSGIDRKEIKARIEGFLRSRVAEVRAHDTRLGSAMVERERLRQIHPAAACQKKMFESLFNDTAIVPGVLRARTGRPSLREGGRS